MNIKNLSLTDFSSKELNFLYLVIDEKRKDFEAKIEIIEKFEASQTKYELHSHFCEQVDYCSQWQTKVDEAQIFVKTREIMTTQN